MVKAAIEKTTLGEIAELCLNILICLCVPVWSTVYL
jgi:hypothetical protein